jgi:hypothetical protein
MFRVAASISQSAGTRNCANTALDVMMEAGIVAFVKDVDACIEAKERAESGFA